MKKIISGIVLLFLFLAVVGLTGSLENDVIGFGQYIIGIIIMLPFTIVSIAILKGGEEW